MAEQIQNAVEKPALLMADLDDLEGNVSGSRRIDQEDLGETINRVSGLRRSCDTNPTRSFLSSSRSSIVCMVC